MSRRSEEVNSGLVKDQNKHADGEHMWGLQSWHFTQSLLDPLILQQGSMAVKNNVVLLYLKAFRWIKVHFRAKKDLVLVQLINFIEVMIVKRTTYGQHTTEGSHEYLLNWKRW